MFINIETDDSQKVHTFFLGHPVDEVSSAMANREGWAHEVKEIKVMFDTMMLSFNHYTFITGVFHKVGQTQTSSFAEYFLCQAMQTSEAMVY